MSNTLFLFAFVIAYCCPLERCAVICFVANFVSFVFFVPSW